MTKPTEEMRKAIAQAEVGDDVWRDDPTLRKLEERMAEITGKEEALFVLSGTMGNQLAIHTQTRTGDEVLCARDSHVFSAETSAAAVIAGVQLRPLDFENGCPNAELVRRERRPQDDHYGPISLFCMENTHNHAGGVVVPLEEMEDSAAAARSLGARVHLDGARLWNVTAATGIAIDRLAGMADTVSLCFSKSLGAPMGSVLAGPRQQIQLARRYRKMYGGGIRQGGILAAACLYALDHHRDRLVEDHRRACEFAKVIADLPALEVDLRSVQTNIVILHLGGAAESPDVSLERLSQRGVWLSPHGPNSLRAMFHLGIDDADVKQAVVVLQEVFAAGRVASS